MDDAYLATIRTFYPDARTTNDTVTRLLDLLSGRLQLEPRQVMSADSICSDDLNVIEYPRRAYEMLGPFKMGGLNGFPFAGLTGMGAFAHHVPEDGAVFVFYGPHIGITRAGTPGQVLRPGQTKASSCCGAAIAAVTKLLSGGLSEAPATELDYQQNTIEQVFWRGRDRIVGAPSPIVAATDVMYDAIETRVDLLASRTSYPCPYLILMGGILINTDGGGESCSSIRRLRCVTLSSGAQDDWLKALWA
jgi:Limiting CO2-inducible proteins B/C beta carbonyic anhydrases